MIKPSVSREKFSFGTWPLLLSSGHGAQAAAALDFFHGEIARVKKASAFFHFSSFFSLLCRPRDVWR